MSIKSDPIRTPEAILSFPFLFQPRAPKTDPVTGAAQGYPKYSCTLVFPAGTDLSELVNAANAVHAQAFPGKPMLSSPIQDGTPHPDWGDIYVGSKFVRVSTKIRPYVLDPAGKRIIDERLIYAGCYVRAVVRCFPYNSNGNRGVSFGLEAIQFLRDGTPISGGAAAASMLTPVGPALQQDQNPAAMFGAPPQAAPQPQAYTGSPAAPQPVQQQMPPQSTYNAPSVAPQNVYNTPQAAPVAQPVQSPGYAAPAAQTAPAAPQQRPPMFGQAPVAQPAPQAAPGNLPPMFQ